jgi:hypothetical protein
VANERERREMEPEAGWTGRMHDPTLRPGERPEPREGPAPGGSTQGVSGESRDVRTSGADVEGDGGADAGTGLEGATASDDETPRGASPPA